MMAGHRWVYSIDTGKRQSLYARLMQSMMIMIIETRLIMHTLVSLSRFLFSSSIDLGNASPCQMMEPIAGGSLPRSSTWQSIDECLPSLSMSAVNLSSSEWTARTRVASHDDLSGQLIKQRKELDDANA